MRGSRYLKIVYAITMLALLMFVPAIRPVASAGTTTYTHLTSQGTINLQSITDGALTTDDGSSLDSFAGLPVDQLHGFNNGANAVHVSAAHIPRPDATPIVTSNPEVLTGFNGLRHLQQRNAGTGIYSNTQFNLEPPDQGLAVGNGFVVEAVNTILRVFSTTGTPMTSVIALNQFFALAPEVIRTPPVMFGNFSSDPKVYYDWQVNRFFLTMVELDRVPSTGAFSGRSNILLAVTQTGDPTGTWNKFSFDVTNDGLDGTPNHTARGCPCFGDQPLIGADANGFIISTNEFPIFVNGFNGAQVYAMDKVALAGGSLPTIVQVDTGLIATPDVGGIWYSVQPATTPPSGSYATNTEYFLSTLQFFSKPATDNRIAVWTMTGTNTLSSANPSVSMTPTVISSEDYGQPPDALQKDGPRPLGTIIIPLLGGKGTPSEKLEFLAGNDDRMNQVVYANGLLWSGFNTVVQVTGQSLSITTVGVAYFIVNPTTPAVVNQGYIAPGGGNSVLFPSIAVNNTGEGFITFTLTGPDFFPSAAYARIDAANGAGPIHIAAIGAFPEDGFSGYHFFGNTRTARWGDYSAAVTDASGNVWIAQEYIPNLSRTSRANWGTFITELAP